MTDAIKLTLSEKQWQAVRDAYMVYEGAPFESALHALKTVLNIHITIAPPGPSEATKQLAREIAADAAEAEGWNATVVGEIRSGQKDGLPCVRTALAALQRAIDLSRDAADLAELRAKLGAE